jgi:hypothetical protein
MSQCYSGALAGVDRDTLQAWLTSAQSALNTLALGQKEITVIVTGGGQHREVTFERNPNSMAQLRAWIGELQRALGTGGRRRAIAVSF